MIVTDVDGSSIPVFIVEEVNDIDEMEEADYYHWDSHMPEFLILVGCPWKITKVWLALSNEKEAMAYMSVHATIPGRPLWKNLKSQYLPKRGLSSTPAQKSKMIDPGRH